jgi:hypothetical protein
MTSSILFRWEFFASLENDFFSLYNISQSA